jgi:prepilin-type N-terminal cleavage/methylation domain-containing protein
MRAQQRTQSGFTLVEMAIVMLIVALLLGGLIPSITSQVDQRHADETSKQLDEIKEALIGYAIINGRLPCPASITPSNSYGVESPLGGGTCSNFYDGYVPAATLGLSGTNSSGLVLDSWGNPIRYAVTKWSSTVPIKPYVFTTLNGISTVGISNLSPDLLVCSTATGISGSPPTCFSGPPSAALTSSPGVPAVIYSTGKNGGYGGTGLDEKENPNPKFDDNDRVFVSHTPTASGSTNGEFDDLVIWISPNVLINRMVAAGKLP